MVTAANRSTVNAKNKPRLLRCIRRYPVLFNGASKNSSRKKATTRLLEQGVVDLSEVYFFTGAYLALSPSPETVSFLLRVTK